MGRRRSCYFALLLSIPLLLIGWWATEWRDVNTHPISEQLHPGTGHLPTEPTIPNHSEDGAQYSEMSIAISTTITRPGPTLPIWLDYHLRRIDLIMIFMDDPTERPLFERIVGGRSVILFNGSNDHPNMSTPSRLMMHQSSNNEVAIAYALANKIKWLMHIDTDEIFYEEGDRSWQTLENVGQVSFVNHEAVPLNHAVTNFFVECTLFKVTGEMGFMAYGNGKSAVRVTPGVRPWGPHAFIDYEGESVTVKRPMILHYPYPSFEIWAAKYEHYGNFSNFWYDDPDQPNELIFMLESRDIVLSAISTGNWEEAHKYFNGQIPDIETRDRLLASDDLRQYSPFADLRESTKY